MAGALPSQSDFFHPASQRPRSDLRALTLAQLGRQQGHRPNGRVVTEFQRVARASTCGDLLRSFQSRTAEKIEKHGMEAEDYDPYYSKYTRRWDLAPITPKLY
jgi:hypothetical protein